MADKLTDAQIDAIVQRVKGQLGKGQDGQPSSSPSSVSSVPPHLSYVGRAGRATPEPGAVGKDGIYPDLDSAVTAARRGYLALDTMTLAKRTELVAAIRSIMRANAELLARMAHEETGLGRVEDKIQKNLLVIEKTPGPESLQPLAWTGDRGLTLVERAPYGVFGVITPSTNPTSTIINNAIGLISAGNAAVFNVHPGAKKVSAYQLQLLNRAIVAAGGPPDLLTAPTEPTVESAQALMQHPGIRILLVTGGGAVVKLAMASGKRAICAGPGNPPVVVDETADLDLAGKQIVFGASFDNNVICVEEKEVFAVECIADKLKAAMLANGAVELPSYRLRALEKLIFDKFPGPREHGVMKKEWIGRNAGKILKELGIDAPDARLVLVEVPVEHPLIRTEQLMPVLPLARVRNVDEGIDLAVQAEHGFGHTASMFSRNIDALSRMARAINTSIFVKNGPNLAGLGYGGEGFTSMSIASPTGEGLTNALTFTRVRRCTLVDHFRIV
ncbi:MAG: aldehyde dehydrogenase EutE [Chloroflexi bacterium HGW-Chloroflexi-1]|nr:MAG: aldehyde dehydrogenase EutE [Chloroflexi bacterium HGW-Chloroflexi-1]